MISINNAIKLQCAVYLHSDCPTFTAGNSSKDSNLRASGLPAHQPCTRSTDHHTSCISRFPRMAMRIAPQLCQFTSPKNHFATVSFTLNQPATAQPDPQFSDHISSSTPTAKMDDAVAQSQMSQIISKLPQSDKEELQRFLKGETQKSQIQQSMSPFLPLSGHHPLPSPYP